MHVKQIGSFGDNANTTKICRCSVTVAKIFTTYVETLCVLSIFLEVFV